MFVVVLLSAIGCSDDDPRDSDLVIYEGWINSEVADNIHTDLFYYYYATLS